MSISKKKLLIYANYYYPEIASLAQLCTDLCQGLQEQYDVTVICAVPCYTGEIEARYLTKSYYNEEYQGVKVLRVKVPQFNKLNKMSRVKHIVIYYLRSILATFRVSAADLVFTVSQPPVLGGLLGVLGKAINRLRGKKTKLIYNIQDYNPEQTMAVGYSKSKLVLGAMMCFDKFSCACADKVIVVGSDMVATMQKRFTKKDGTLSKRMPETVFINNWMDEQEIHPLPKDDAKVVAFKKQYGLDGKFVVMYSGNVGLFYDLENLFKVIEWFKDDDTIVFPIVGEGSLKLQLEEYAQTHQMKNVVFIPYQAKEDLIYSLNAGDVHWVVNAKGIKGVSCPSKIYGVLAGGRPALAVLEQGTEAREIVENIGCGRCCDPEDYEAVAQNIKWFAAPENREVLAEMGQRGREYLVTHFTKDISIEKYKKELQTLL